MIPLAVVNQGKTSVQVPITYSGSILNGVIWLDEEFKKVMGRWPTATENVTFTIVNGLTVIPTALDEHGLNSGSHWGTDNTIIVNNYATIYGRGGDGGTGALVVRHSSTGTIRISADKGQDGFSAVDNTTSAKMTVFNYGKLIAGGGGGGGGAAWEYVLPDDRYGNITWWSRRDGSSAGGGAPNGRRSHPVGSPEWYIKLASTPSTYQSTIDRYNTLSDAKPKPKHGLIIKNNGGTTQLWHPNGKYYNGKPNNVDVDSTTTVNLSLSKPLSKLGQFILPKTMPTRTYRNNAYESWVKSNYSDSPLSKRYVAKNLIGQELIRSSLTFTGGIGPSVLMSTDSISLTPGWGGSYTGLTHYSSPIHNYDKWDGTSWIGAPSGTEYIVYKVWDDNFGGDGGAVAQDGAAGHYESFYVTGRLAGRAGDYRIRRLPKSYIDNNKHLMFFEPPAAGGRAGYVKTGKVTIVNESGGSTKGR